MDTKHADPSVWGKGGRPMSCKRFQRLLHLNQPGEISQQEAEELRQHLRRCEMCSLEYRRIQRADGFIDELRSFAPTPRDSNQLTAGILRRIRTESAPQYTIGLVDRILGAFLQPSVRFAALAVILILVSTFMIQLLGVLGSVSALEVKLASGPPASRVAAEPVYTAQSTTLQKSARPEDLQSLPGVIPVTVESGRFTIPAKDVESILSQYTIESVASMVGASALRVDRTTIEKIIHELRSTAALTFRGGREGA